jgi:hypothetical protein
LVPSIQVLELVWLCLSPSPSSWLEDPSSAALYLLDGRLRLSATYSDLTVRLWHSGPVLFRCTHSPVAVATARLRREARKVCLSEAVSSAEHRIRPSIIASRRWREHQESILGLGIVSTLSCGCLIRPFPLVSGSECVITKPLRPDPRRVPQTVPI